MNFSDNFVKFKHSIKQSANEILFLIFSEPLTLFQAHKIIGSEISREILFRGLFQRAIIANSENCALVCEHFIAALT